MTMALGLSCCWLMVFKSLHPRPAALFLLLPPLLLLHHASWVTITLCQGISGLQCGIKVAVFDVPPQYLAPHRFITSGLHSSANNIDSASEVV